eukprot:scaffold3541_cov252-Pinguiococcus_pyrenoidosus.AAC.8
MAPARVHGAAPARVDGVSWERVSPSILSIPAASSNFLSSRSCAHGGSSQSTGAGLPCESLEASLRVLCAEALQHSFPRSLAVPDASTSRDELHENRVV